jgi:anaerobic magnesium-protoporphyrin IX monomethyl ester cyclase
VNILLIQPENNFPTIKYAPSQALLILGTLAQNRGHKVKILHIDVWDRSLKIHLETFQPDIIGVTINTYQVSSARYAIDMIKTISKNAKIVIGGPHAEYFDREIDKRVIGEGENKWLALLEHEPMTELPPINYDLIDFNDFTGIYPTKTTPSTCLMASRGCFASCTFCNTPIFWGTKIKLGKPKYIINELQRLHDNWGMKEVVFQDDTFNASVGWATEILERIIATGLNNKILLRLVWRVNEKLITQELLDLAKKAGVWNIFYGVESGSQMMLDRMRKGITIPEIKRAFNMTHKTGIETIASFIVGLPGETWNTIWETQKLISEIKPTYFDWSFFVPFPGTEATREVISKGHLKNIDYGRYGSNRLLYARTDEMTFEDLKEFGGFNK